MNSQFRQSPNQEFTQQHISHAAHQLLRFVTREAVALKLNMRQEHIYRISYWDKIIHVVGKGISIFVSYADMPPILGVAGEITVKDILCWRKRWKKNKENKAPEFWVGFYAQKFRRSAHLEELEAWSTVVSQIAFGLTNAAKEWLYSVFVTEQEDCMVPLLKT